MSKQVQDAYIVAATRTPIGRSGRGYFKNTRPDALLVAAIHGAMKQVPGLDPKSIEDAIVGCAMPEGEQGMNIARIGAILAGLPNSVGGITVNRFCASGISAVAQAADRIRVGEAEVMIAAGVESMSMVPMGGNKPSFSPEVFARDENIGIAYGMGLTAENVAKQWKVSREDQDAFGLESHRRAIAAQQAGQPPLVRFCFTQAFFFQCIKIRRPVLFFFQVVITGSPTRKFYRTCIGWIAGIGNQCSITFIQKAHTYMHNSFFRTHQRKNICYSIQCHMIIMQVPMPDCIS